MSISRWWCRAVPGTREAGGCDVACDVAWSLPGSAGQAFHAGQPVSRRTTMSISRWWCRAVLGTREAGGPGSSEDDPPGPANHTRDRSDGRGLNPSPDERGPAVAEYDDLCANRASGFSSRTRRRRDQLASS